MEPHGENTEKLVVANIPARYGSVRLPGKLLMEVGGKPLILHTLDRAASAATVSRVMVATDDQRIFDVVTSAGGEAVMTSQHHDSGTDRVAEIAETLPHGALVVNVQADEPLISPATIDAAVNALIADPSADMATTSANFTNAEDILDPNIVKVVTGSEGYALYFSRSPVPFPRDAVAAYGGLADALRNQPDLLYDFRRHMGLYVYRREFLLAFSKLSPSMLEQTEKLEQLRALEADARIRVVEVDDDSIGVDTHADLERVRQILNGK